MQPPYGPLGLVGVGVVRRGEEGSRAGEEMEGRERATLRESKRESPCLSPSHIRSSEADADLRHPRDPVRPPPPRVLPFVAIATRAIYPEAVAGAAPAVPDVLATAQRVTCPSSFPPPMTVLLRPSPFSPKNPQEIGRAHV